MPLTEIKRRIEEESKAQIKAIHDGAQKEKDNIINEAKEKAKDIVKGGEDETSRVLNWLKLEQSASSELSVREIELTAREEAMMHEIARTRAELMKRIKGNKALYRKLFSDAIKSASEIAPIREFSIITNRNDKELVGKTDARIEYQSLGGGLIIQSLDKSVRIDATLENMIDSNEESIKSMLLNAMFKSRPNPQTGSKPASQKRAAKKRKKSPKPKGRKRK